MDPEFRGEVEGVVAWLNAMADAMAMDGKLAFSGNLLAARQCIRVLATKVEAAEKATSGDQPAEGQANATTNVP